MGGSHTHLAALEAAVSTTAAAPANCSPHKTLAAAVVRYVVGFIFTRIFPFNYGWRTDLVMYEDAQHSMGECTTSRWFSQAASCPVETLHPKAVAKAPLVCPLAVFLDAISIVVPATLFHGGCTGSVVRVIPQH